MSVDDIIEELFAHIEEIIDEMLRKYPKSEPKAGTGAMKNETPDSVELVRKRQGCDGMFQARPRCFECPIAQPCLGMAIGKLCESGLLHERFDQKYGGHIYVRGKKNPSVKWHEPEERRK